MSGALAVCALAPLLVWGLRAMMGKSLRYAMWRAVAWPLGTLTVAAGLGVFPAPQSLPAGSGGLIGIAAAHKEGGLADFSSRGTPRDERLGNDDPLDDYDAPTLTASW